MAKNCYRLLHCRNFLKYFRLVFLCRKKQSQSGSVAEPLPFGAAPPRSPQFGDGSAPDFLGRGPGFESGIYHNDPDALKDHCEIK